MAQGLARLQAEDRQMLRAQIRGQGKTTGVLVADYGDFGLGLEAVCEVQHVPGHAGGAAVAADQDDVGQGIRYGQGWQPPKNRCCPSEFADKGQSLATI